jgi:cytochrome P450
MDNKDASKPFLMGPRGCIGVNLAYMEMRTILTRLVWEFDLQLIIGGIGGNNHNKFLALVWSKAELRVRFRPRA